MTRRTSLTVADWQVLRLFRIAKVFNTLEKLVKLDLWIERTIFLFSLVRLSHAATSLMTRECCRCWRWCICTTAGSGW